MFVANLEQGLQLLERRGEARLVLQALAPHLRVHPVVRLLAVDLRRQAGDLGVVGLLQRLDASLVGALVDAVPRDRSRPVRDEPKLDELGATVLARLAVERKLVRGRAELPRRELVQRPRVPDLVLRDRREGDVLLEHGRDARPL